MQIEHVTNAETVIRTNYQKTKKKKKPKRKKNASGGITTREYSHRSTGIKFINNSSKE